MAVTIEELEQAERNLIQQRHEGLRQAHMAEGALQVVRGQLEALRAEAKSKTKK